MFINDLLEELETLNISVTIIEIIIPALLNCHDMILLANNSANLKILLTICERHSNRWNYKFNPDKCFIVIHYYTEPIQEILITRNPRKNVEIQQEFIEQIPPNVKVNTIASALIDVES